MKTFVYFYFIYIFFSFCVDPEVVYIILFNFVLRTALGGR